MIYGVFHKGSGLGNQLHRYVGTKVIALEKGEEHTMIAPELFKGKDFLKLDLTQNDIKYTIEEPAGKVIPESYEGVIDGEFQAEKDFVGHLDKIRGWVKSKDYTVGIADDVCVINFRGGEYVGVRDLFLPQEYWDMAISEMRKINPKMRFLVVTDDPDTASRFFNPLLIEITHDITMDWLSILNAPYLILSNSSFAILPAYLGNAKKIIAPKYWAGYNKKEWVNPDNATYSKFTYIHHED
jgi:hypothetical protein